VAQLLFEEIKKKARRGDRNSLRGVEMVVEESIKGRPWRDPLLFRGWVDIQKGERRKWGGRW